MVSTEKFIYIYNLAKHKEKKTDYGAFGIAISDKNKSW